MKPCDGMFFAKNGILKVQYKYPLFSMVLVFERFSP